MHICQYKESTHHIVFYISITSSSLVVVFCPVVQVELGNKGEYRVKMAVGMIFVIYPTKEYIYFFTKQGVVMYCVFFILTKFNSFTSYRNEFKRSGNVRVYIIDSKENR